MQAEDAFQPPDKETGEASKSTLSESTASEFSQTACDQTSKPTALAKTFEPIKKRLKLIRESRLYEFVAVAGKGAFGVVYRGFLKSEPNTPLAIKQTVYDPCFSLREVKLLAQLNHPNCIRMRRYFIENDKDFTGKTMNIVMDFYPYTLDRAIYSMMRAPAIRLEFIRSWAFQLLSAVEHLHSQSICHRDIKPQNLLIDFSGQILVLGDLGSAKVIGDQNVKSVAYVCSRFYRAPELIIGDENYGLQTDMWSVGCVFAEMWLGEPLFRGRSSKDQFVKIMQVLGSPAASDLEGMSNSVQVNLPKMEGIGLEHVMGPCDMGLLDLIWRLLRYNPKQRLTAKEAKGHAFFTAVRGDGGSEIVSGVQSDLIECLRCG